MDKYVRNMIISVDVVATVTYLSLNYLFTNNIFLSSIINTDKSFDRLFPPTKEDDRLSTPLDKSSAITPVADRDKKYDSIDWQDDAPSKNLSVEEMDKILDEKEQNNDDNDNGNSEGCVARSPSVNFIKFILRTSQTKCRRKG